ncbi:hypothetical protein H310_14324 [Aphanomyces invadans]|uniref:JmjC domain-containing protein n=1 Tax=Aphanomyces invadans TaxID=157072 RepID=A0A024TCD9_9STRA|nr:hypothetical protein H310_14324 [Aphanomyces invadans]ETV90987.1 hypothetical protein H310_14324 [Aphanomyces invadans]|eukprot:XP_008880376.1 hypothetical protein H310_14324 [Aphanomyces invadans]
MASAPGALCPEFHPTVEEFACFATYIRTVVEPACQHVGMCKIVPPDGFFARTYDDLEFTIPTPLTQHVAGKKGVFHVDLVARKSMQLDTFRALADAAAPKDLQDPATAPLDVLERKFWKGLRPTMDPPTYGADIVGSLFGDDPAMSWNVNDLDSILRTWVDLPGITQAMLYFGMWSAMFALHTEDMELYSINYLHTGKPKVWYTVPPHHAARVERVCQTMFPHDYVACHEFLRHKTSLVSPAKLHEFDVPYYRAVQGPGDFIITFPRAYHQGFNTGFNIAESVNFATLRWIAMGLDAKVCKCAPNNVTLDMDLFLTQLFTSSRPGSRAIAPDDWVLSCQCHKVATSADDVVDVDERWFECSTCSIWCHLRCRYPSLWEAQDHTLPATLLCHRCDVASCPPRKKHPPTTIEMTSTKANESGGGNVLAKNAIVLIESNRRCVREAKVVAVDGKYIRVHFKGESCASDEWMPSNSTTIVGIGPKTSPPQKQPTARRRSRSTTPQKAKRHRVMPT